jgi:hypothetical protein
MAVVSTTVDVEASIRPITDDEVAFYREHGWVKLDGLVALDLVDRLREVAEARVAESDHGWLRDLARTGVEPFRSLMFSPTMAQNAQRLADRRRLTDRDIALRYRWDGIANKLPGGGGTPWHQDSSEHGSDRVGEMQWWLALVEITPEMGAMRFLSGMHREGPLGSTFNDDHGDLLAQYPKLTELYELSPPFHYQPGDATVHHGYMAHGAPPNETDRHRLAYLYSYVPDDTRWWGGHTENSGAERVRLPDDPYAIVSLRQDP